MRYCGGCNPRYDRVAALDQLKSYFPSLTFVSAEAGIRYAAVVLVHGCPTCCVGVSDLPLSGGRLVRLGGWEDLPAAQARLSQVLESHKSICLSHSEIQDLLPHCGPALFLDEVSDLIPGTELTATFSVRPELPVLRAYPPMAPVFPASCIIEAALQAASLLLFSPEPSALQAFRLREVRKAVFGAQVIAGDLLDIHASLSEGRQEDRTVSCRVLVFTSGEQRAELELLFALR